MLKSFRIETLLYKTIVRCKFSMIDFRLENVKYDIHNIFHDY